MRIAICDDNQNMATQLETLLEECFENRYLFESDIYLSGEDLLVGMAKDGIYQIYILDIEMAGMNGLELAKIIRKHDVHGIIIFVTSHAEFMQEAFEVLAFHFLTKPLDEERVKQVIIRAAASLTAKKTVFPYNIRKRSYAIAFEELEYFESYNRKVLLHCRDREEVIEYYGSISEVLDKLDSNLFAQVHKSYIVNLDCVRVRDGSKVILNSGSTITITKKYSKSFNTAYRNFVMMRMNG